MILLKEAPKRRTFVRFQAYFQRRSSPLRGTFSSFLVTLSPYVVRRLISRFYVREGGEVEWEELWGRGQDLVAPTLPGEAIATVRVYKRRNKKRAKAWRKYLCLLSHFCAWNTSKVYFRNTGFKDVTEYYLATSYHLSYSSSRPYLIAVEVFLVCSTRREFLREIGKFILLTPLTIFPILLGETHSSPSGKFPYTY